MAHSLFTFAVYMKYLFLAVLFLSFSLFSFSQEGEGDIYMKKLLEEKNKNVTETIIYDDDPVVIYDARTYVEEDTLIETTEEYIVDNLFTKLSFDQVKNRALIERKNYYIDFTAEWCAPCKMMDKTTFRDYLVVSYTQKNYIAVQLDMTDFDAIEMQAIYNIKSLPSILFFDYNGNLIDRALGYQTGTLFLKKLKEVHLAN